MLKRFVRRVEIPAPVEDVFAWHGSPGALERLSPPWERVTVEQAPQGLEVGTRVVLRTGLLGPIAARWVAEHVACDPPHEFRDVQVSGPFAAWNHRHRFDRSAAGTVLCDDVAYRLPFGGLGEAVAGRAVEVRLRRLFDYRHRQTADDLAAHRRARQTMHVAVTGASGMIGSALVAFLRSGGHQVTRLVRRPAGAADEASWDPQRGRIDAERLRGVDAVVNLAGEQVGKRFTAEHNRRVRSSRVEGTRLIAETIAKLEDGPRILVNPSGIGYYGADRGDEILTEESSSGGGFLAEVVRAWEAATEPARQAGARVVLLRTGIVQSPTGGPLRLQLPLFRLCLGGRLGSGRQWLSWITLDDTVGVYHHALTSDVEGPINATAPDPVTNAEFTRMLGTVLHRPALIPVPAFGPAVLFNPQGAREFALANQRVLPVRAEASGYVFRHRDLESGLRHILGR